jgi:16S rRNA (cytosine967-C5)-methyltransferase
VTRHSRAKVSRTGRELAAEVMIRVLGEGAWIAPSLDAALRKSELDPREAARGTDLVYGSTRAIGPIRAGIDRQRPKKTPLEPLTEAVLVTSVFELSGHPGQAHAIVSSAVDLVRRERGEGLARFVNAILRKLAATPPDLTPRLPRELRALIVRSIGEARTSAIEGSLARTPWLGLRVEPKAEREVVRELIRAARPDAEILLGALSPRALLVRGVGDPRSLPRFADGLYAVQEEGSQVLATLVGARAGERVLDACAGHGGKTAVLARAVENGSVVALDLHEAKLASIANELDRLGIPRARLSTRTVDLTVGAGGLAADFDRVLVDAPCTGLGTLARRPEIALRLGKDDPARLAETQLAILKTAASLVRPGGTLVYAVCTPTEEEGTAVVRRFLASEPRAKLVASASPVAPDPDEIVRIGPWNDPNAAADAYQAATFVLS